MKNIPLLKSSDVDVKIKQVTEKGAILLLYKNARTDMRILDEVFGVENWVNDYKEIGCVLYCGIGIRNNENEQFIWKWSNGIESREDFGNEKKGEASDAFKRAGFVIGIGRELYTAPFIFIKIETESFGKAFRIKNKNVKFYCKEIYYNEDRTIKNVVIVDEKGNVVFGAQKHKTPSESDYSTVPEKPKQTQNNVEETIDEEIINDILFTANINGFTDDIVILWVNKKFGKNDLKDLTINEANELLKALKKYN